MSARRRVAVLAGVLAVLTGPLVATATPDDRGPVRSELYPEHWQPARPDAEGRFLHDFSYAGYGYGAEVPREVPGRVVDVTDPAYGADRTGTQDATAAIQAAIDDVGAEGGGTVLLPAGTYRVLPPDDSRAVLHVAHDGVLLRGEGAGRTRLYAATAENMRSRAVVLVGPDRSDWHHWHAAAVSPGAIALTRDVTAPTRTVHLADVAPLAVGDWVVLAADTTEEWLAEHPVGAEEAWGTGTLEALVLHRRITAVDPDAGTVELDIPTRYPMLRRDGVRLVPVEPPVLGSGVADLALGMRQSDLPGSPDDEDDHDLPGTSGQQAHQAVAIAFNDAVDGWVVRVQSYRPADNADEVHLLSAGVHVRDARNVTIADTDLRHPQYRGAGGNGYLYHLMGSDSLVRDAYAEGGRHNYLVQAVQATGNVVLDSRAVDGERATELHRHLSAANLFDNLTLDGDTLEMRYREVSTHAHSATQSVMWNVSGTDCTRGRLAVSQQYGWGYVIGTSGAGDCALVENPGGQGTEPRDWVELLGEGDRLEPRSLYLDQLDRRHERDEQPAGAATAPSTAPSSVASASTEPAAEEPPQGGGVPVVAVVGVVVVLAGAGAVLVRRRGRQ